MRFPTFSVFSLFFLAATACSPDGVDGNPDDTLEGSSDPTNPTDTVPGDPTDNPSVSKTVTVFVPTKFEEEDEPCAITLIHTATGHRFEGQSGQGIMVSGVEEGDELVALAGYTYVTPTSSQGNYDDLDPPGGLGLPLHDLADGTLAISAPITVTVGADGSLVTDEINFHRYAEGRWTLAFEGRWEYFSTDPVRTLYIAHPETGEPTLVVSWGGGWESYVDGSTYIPRGDSSASGYWNADGTVTLNLVSIVAEFDHVFTAFSGEESDDPRHP
jgi:hypothetical protein